MSLTTIAIGGNDYVSYASVEEADARLAVDPVRGASWASKTPDQKGILLVASTNRLDLFKFKGEKTDPAQLNQFPRTGLTTPDGQPVSDTEVPWEIEQATILLAGTIGIKPTAAGAGGSGGNQRRVKAGSAEVEFFAPTKGKPLADEEAYAFLSAYLNLGLGLGNFSGGGMASGTCEEPFNTRYGKLSEPFA